MEPIECLCSACNLFGVFLWIYRNFFFSCDKVFILSNCYFWLVITYIRFSNATGSAFSFPFTFSFKAINQSRGVGCLIFSLFAVNVTLKSGSKKKRQWVLHLILSTSIIHELPLPGKAECSDLILNPSPERTGSRSSRDNDFYMKKKNATWIFLMLYCTDLNIAQVRGGLYTMQNTWKYA